MSDKIWIIVYDHKYGQDVLLYKGEKTEKRAMEVAIDIAEKWKKKDGYKTDLEGFDLVINWNEVTNGLEDIIITSAVAEECCERDIHKLLTTEMDEDEWKKFSETWIKDWAKSLQAECGFDEDDAVERASIDFEEYCGQEGWTERDERVAMEREIKNG